MTATPTPWPTNTDAAETIGGKVYGRSTLHDSSGADAMGVVGASPAALTILGRLKTIGDGIAALAGYTDGLEGLIGDVRTLLTTQAGYVDGLEGLIGSTNTALATNNTATALTTPADDVFAIAKSDTVDLPVVPKALLCTAAGDVALRGTSGVTVTIAVLAGQILPIRARRVMTTGTSATVFGLA